MEDAFLANAFKLSPNRSGFIAINRLRIASTSANHGLMIAYLFSGIAHF